MNEVQVSDLAVAHALLREALDNLIWCSGAPCFQPAGGGFGGAKAGEARVGWERGPMLLIPRIADELSKYRV